MENSNKEMNPVLSLQQTLQNRRDALAKSLAIVEEELKAVDITLRLLRNGHSTASEASFKPANNASPVDIDFTGMTQLGALLAIALNANGHIRIVEARKVLEKAGLLKRSKNGYNILYNVINKSNRFERSGRGEYKLLSEYEHMIDQVMNGQNASVLVRDILAQQGPHKSADN